MSQISSPLKDNVDCIVEKEIDSAAIIKGYLDAFGIDVSRFFLNTEVVLQCQCPVTGYRFYYPLHLAGDGDFYARLQKNEWYYMPWKWEHEQTLKIISPQDRILEIGCGEGGFVEKLHNSGFDIVGLELNDEAVSSAQKKGLRVFSETIQDHAIHHSEYYDVVCFYQVLEHIAHPRDFLVASLKCLKKGGRLIVCVPNNDSFLKDIDMLVINMPPHHMGLWSALSLRKLAALFSISLDEISYEPLQRYHDDLYISVLRNKYFKGRVLGYVYKRLKIYYLLKKVLRGFRHKITGHSIMAIYRK